ncbi:hypothetical protein R6Q57_024851 [Mikania cordata]
MRDMWSMPSILNILNNPEIMHGMITSNPHMREIIDRNPELARILNDPAILGQTLEAARNTELVPEMMRNTDRAMSNIDSSPEGFNMLRRMYENVQEPVMNSATGGNDSMLNPFATLLGNQDVVNNTSAAGFETTQGSAVPNSNPLPNPWGGGVQANAGIRAPNVSGLGGLGLPGLDRPTGMPDMSQSMQNPAISQMMQSLLSDSQYMEQIVNQNPQLCSMFDSNPQLREMIRNPEILHQLTLPQMMQQMMPLQQLLPQLNQQQSTLDHTRTGAITVPPKQLYATQLSQLQEMGFFDTEENISALHATSGNVHAAFERLLGNFGS